MLQHEHCTAEPHGTYNLPAESLSLLAHLAWVKGIVSYLVLSLMPVREVGC